MVVDPYIRNSCTLVENILCSITKIYTQTKIKPFSKSKKLLEARRRKKPSLAAKISFHFSPSTSFLAFFSQFFQPSLGKKKPNRSAPMDAAKLKELKNFVDLCKSNPTVLTDPSISFFRDYVESLGGKLPPAAYSRSHVEEESDEEIPDKESPSVEEPEEEEEEEDEIIESDVELEGDAVEPDNDPPQKMGDSSVEVTEENRDASQEAKGKAMEAISEGKLEDAIQHLTEAILLNPLSAIMYGTRATVYIKMKKPNAAIRDANAALEINPDSAKGYKARGMARALLGQWEEAAKDLHVASKLDYDEEISAVLKKVEPNAHKIEEHRKKYDRLRKEREDRKAERERRRRRAKAQAEYERAKKQEQSSSSSRPGGMPGGFPGMPGGFPGMPGGFPGMPGGFGGMPGGFPGGMPAGMGGSGMPGGGGGMPGGGMPGNVDFSKILNDPELMSAFSDPEVMAALQDVMKNPANLAKHQSNPKVAPVIAKMMNKFSGPK
ncbi:FAM10 family protein At4g22670 [Linum perenne]